MIDLTPEQVATIEQLSRDSFESFCNKCGHDPDQYRSNAMNAMRTIAKEHVKLLKHHGADGSFYENLQTCSWEQMLVSLDNADLDTTVEFVLRGNNRTMINWQYLEDLSKQLEIEATNQDDLLEKVTRGVPRISLWETKFNAFVTRSTLIDEIPCVASYHHLSSAVMALTDICANALMDFGPNGMDFVDPVDLGKQPEFIAACFPILRGVLGGGSGTYESPAELSFTASQPDRLLEFTMLTSGANLFVDLHEYGHLLCGHLEIGGCHEVENEADLFAIESMSYVGAAEYHYLAVGATITFFCLLLLERSNKSDSASHPPASKRVVSFLNHTRKAVGNRCIVFLEYLLKLFRPAASKYLGRNLGLDSSDAELLSWQTGTSLVGE